MRLLGIDYGTKKIGIALSDEVGGFAFPYSVVENDKKAVEVIKNICQKEGAKKIVLGESVDYTGKPNPIMRRIERFRERVEKETGLFVVYQSEVLTTQEAKRSPKRAINLSALSFRGRKRAKKGQIIKNDASEAALILRSFIEQRKT